MLSLISMKRTAALCALYTTGGSVLEISANKKVTFLKDIKNNGHAASTPKGTGEETPRHPHHLRGRKSVIGGTDEQEQLTPNPVKWKIKAQQGLLARQQARELERKTKTPAEEHGATSPVGGQR
ncbi:unnamed protein product [Amoebophrya sp. A25]|nr:unnamed protein product [Amoebophrya sp. A25]|eukprot:GSA25T00022945001.1